MRVSPFVVSHGRTRLEIEMTWSRCVAASHFSGKQSIDG